MNQREYTPRCPTIAVVTAVAVPLLLLSRLYAVYNPSVGLLLLAVASLYLFFYNPSVGLLLLAVASQKVIDLLHVSVISVMAGIDFFCERVLCLPCTGTASEEGTTRRSSSRKRERRVCKTTEAAQEPTAEAENVTNSAAEACTLLQQALLFRLAAKIHELSIWPTHRQAPSLPARMRPCRPWLLALGMKPELADSIADTGDVYVGVLLIVALASILAMFPLSVQRSLLAVIKELHRAFTVRAATIEASRVDHTATNVRPITWG